MTSVPERDFKGYGGRPPNVRWPERARVALPFVVNLEEGAELSVSDGDECNEGAYEAVEEVVGYPDLCQDSHFEYGTRAGWRRVAAVLAESRAVATVNACGRAVERSAWLAREAVDQGHEISCHGWRWERHAGMGEEVERRAIAKTVAAIREATGVTPVGWHTRSAPSVNTRRLLMEHGGFLYDSRRPHAHPRRRGPHGNGEPPDNRRPLDRLCRSDGPVRANAHARSLVRCQSQVASPAMKERGPAQMRTKCPSVASR